MSQSSDKAMQAAREFLTDMYSGAGFSDTRANKLAAHLDAFAADAVQEAMAESPDGGFWLATMHKPPFPSPLDRCRCGATRKRHKQAGRCPREDRRARSKP